MIAAGAIVISPGRTIAAGVAVVSCCLVLAAGAIVISSDRTAAAGVAVVS